MQKVLLINPVLEPLNPLTTAHEQPFIQKKGLIVPLPIATISALTPDDFEVDLWDEAIHPLIDDTTAVEKPYDLVGITGLSNQRSRTIEIARVFRKRGIPVAIGGPGVTSDPEEYRNHFDILFIGEAEETWPEFIADFRNGRHKNEYKALTFPDMALSPAPRWGRIADRLSTDYLMGALQTTRGCIFACEFCSIPMTAGRRMRVKPIDRVLEEITEMKRLGVRDIWVCSDNFIGDPGYARDLLAEIASLNSSFDTPMNFLAEVSLNVARMDDMLELMSKAHFTTILVGIESSNNASLKEVRKFQNLSNDIVVDCKKIMSHGIIITGSMIVGFDHDTTHIFDSHFRLVQAACIPHPQFSILKAIKGTRLYDRFLKEGRILNDSFFSGPVHPQIKTNIIPEKMSRSELMTGYVTMLEKIFDWDNFAERVKGFMLNLESTKSGADAFEILSGSPPHWTILNAVDNPSQQRALSGIWNSLAATSNEKGVRAIYNILALTRERAPFMLHEIVRLIVKQFLDSSGLPLLREAVEKQVNIEEGGNIQAFVRR